MANVAKVFLGSSKEAQPYAESIQTILFSLGAEVTAWWSDSAFPVGSTFIESLIGLTTLTNASLLVASEDDVTNKRGQSSFTPRDNVIFEHWMFTAAHGRGRSAIATLGDPKLPTDLLGVVVIQLQHAKSTDEFKERNRDGVRKWFDRLKQPSNVNMVLGCELREQIAYFMKDMDEIWAAFDVGWDLIHLQNYAAEASLALALDEFFQNYHRFFDFIRRAEASLTETARKDIIHKANICLLTAWEHVAQGKISLADEDIKEPDLRRALRPFKGIYDQAAFYFKQGKNSKLGVNERLNHLKKSVALADEFLKKAVQGQGVS